MRTIQFKGNHYKNFIKCSFHDSTLYIIENASITCATYFKCYCTLPVGDVFHIHSTNEPYSIAQINLHKYYRLQFIPTEQTVRDKRLRISFGVSKNLLGKVRVSITSFQMLCIRLIRAFTIVEVRYACAVLCNLFFSAY